MGDASEVNRRLSTRGLEPSLGPFLPQHFSRSEKVDEDRVWLRDTLRLMADGSPSGPTGSRSCPTTSTSRTGERSPARIEEHPEAWLSEARFDTLIDNLHVVARICREEGFEPVVHPHAGTYIETADEIARVMDLIDRPCSGCASTRVTSGSVGPTRPRRSTTTTTSSDTSTSRTARRRSWTT